MTPSQSRAFGARDVALVEELARRCSLVIENMRLRDAERRATRTRDEVLGVVAHDLRSPLSSILLQAQLMRRQGSITLGAKASGREVTLSVTDTGRDVAERLATLDASFLPKPVAFEALLALVEPRDP